MVLEPMDCIVLSREKWGQKRATPLSCSFQIAAVPVSGGSPQLLSYTNQDRFELQNFTRLLSGKHNIRWGGLLRAISLHDRATQNYAGTFTFTSRDSYRLTVLGCERGLTPRQIRASGGGASQFSISGGDPVVAIRQADFGFFLRSEEHTSELQSRPYLVCRL